MPAALLAVAFLLGPDAAPAPTVVGTWVLVKGSACLPTDVKFVVEFGPGGRMALRFDTGDPKRDAEHTGKYKLDGKKLTYTLTTGAGEKTESLTVKALSHTELVLTDPDGKTEEFKRAKK